MDAHIQSGTVEYTFRSYNPKAIVRKLAEYFDAGTVKSDSEVKVSLPAGVGKGIISGIDFQDGMCVLIIACTFKQDTTMVFPVDKRQPLNFFYCSHGTLSHTIKQDDYKRQYEPMDGAIVAGTKGSEQVLHFAAGTATMCHILQIYRHQYLPLLEKELGVLPKMLNDILRDLKGKFPVSYQSQYGMRIADALQVMVKNGKSGFTRRLKLQAKALDILYYQIAQVKREVEQAYKKVNLRKDEVGRILEARDALINNLEAAPSIAQLSKKAGINITKLKKDFKTVFGKTIGNYLRDERMKYAWLLFSSQGYPVTRVAHAVGYANVSHFSRRFKEKYGILPKDLLKMSKTELPEDENGGPGKE